jgi:hypothetical protein
MSLVNLAFRSPAARDFTRKRHKAVPKNLYVPSNTPAPELNMSYVENRNESVRNLLNWTTTGSSSEIPLTNNQTYARMQVARKMARGEPVSTHEKVRAGIVRFPKPQGPKPVRGGKKRKTRRTSRK